MTKLTTHLPQETVQKSKALQGVETDTFYTRMRIRGEWKSWQYTNKKIKYDFPYEAEYLSRPTIADVIDNAEELFYDIEYNSCNIILICQQNKTIQEISDYILSNIKE